jgi:hypothetical protein
MEIPDDIFKKAKLLAVQEGVALKEVITRALVREVTPGSSSAALRKSRAARLFKELDNAGNPHLLPAREAWNPVKILKLPVLAASSRSASLVNAVREERETGW